MYSTMHTDFVCGVPVNVPNTTSDYSTTENLAVDEFIASYFNLDQSKKGYAKGQFYVSYNNWDISIYGSDTTALVWSQMLYFFILNGDHRKQYDQLAKYGFDACFEYFKANKHLQNKHSERDKSMMALEIKLAHPVERLNWMETRFLSSVF